MKNQPSTQHWYEIEFPSSENGSSSSPTSYVPFGSSRRSHESSSNGSSDNDSPQPEPSND